MSLRKKVIESLITAAYRECELMDCSDFDEEEEILDVLWDNLFLVVSQRYLQMNDPVPKSSGWLTQVLPELDAKRFRVMLRMTRKQFEPVVEALQNNPIFLTTKNQLSVEIQVAIVMFRLGSYGSGCSLAKLATLFGIGDGGTIDRITARVFTAILSLEDKYIYWPTASERAEICENIGEEFPQCVGFLDGTEFNLAEAPSLDHTSYYSRKQRYSIKAQAVCDYSFKIRYLHVGYPGSSHDAKIFTNSDLGRNTSNYLNGAQWLAADSAYKLTDTVITPFRKNSTFKTKREREKFNRYFSSFRVKIEQCFGIMKNKFSSLKELRTRIKDKDSHAFVCSWIRVCATLHNMLLPQYDDKDKEYCNEVDEEDDDEHPLGDQNARSSKRAALFSLLESKF